MSDPKPCRHCGSIEVHVCAPVRRRGKAVKRRNEKRKAKDFAKNFGSVERVLAVKAMACLAKGALCDGPVVNAHVRARGMGAAKGDLSDIVPLCQLHHEEAGEMPGPGVPMALTQRGAFQALYGLDLQAEATRVAKELDGRGL